MTPVAPKSVHGFTYVCVRVCLRIRLCFCLLGAHGMVSNSWCVARCFLSGLLCACWQFVCCVGVLCVVCCLLDGCIHMAGCENWLHAPSSSGTYRPRMLTLSPESGFLLFSYGFQCFTMISYGFLWFSFGFPWFPIEVSYGFL